MKRAIGVFTALTLSACELLVGIDPLSGPTEVAEAGPESSIVDGGTSEPEVVVPAPDTGPVPCVPRVAGPASAHAVELTGEGLGWVNTGNVLDDNDGTGADTQSSCCGPAGYQALNATDFRFALPASARVTGVSLQTRVGGSAGGHMREESVRLTYANSGDGGADLKGPNEYGAPEPRDYGGEGNLWGLPLTAPIVNAPSFGVAYRPTNPGGVATVRLYSVRLTVFYCE